MKQIYKRYYFYFWLSALFLIIIGYLPSFLIGDSALDINIHDTYYVIATSHVSILLSTFYILCGLIYRLFKFINLSLIPVLTKIHSISTISIIPIYFIGYFLIGNTNKSEFPLFDDTSKLNLFITAIVIIYIIAQLLFILNIILSVLKHFSRKNKA